jgi:hypothetical protein
VLAIHTRIIPVFVKSNTSWGAPILQKHEPVRGGIEQLDLLSCWVHDAIINDFVATRYPLSGTASKGRAH